ncbi:YmfQ family protein [Humitalea sp. 24SJ18S-53]|uniref:YmfQ family protein n=1 Tax=Humitalea sp. 24SJ18S-53 TaxID=3422307 RepID=UPI003D67C609
MPRDTAAVTAALLALLPQGWAWSRSPDAVAVRLLAAPAAEIATMEAAIQQLLDEVADPRLADAMLPDFERVLGPDPCGRDMAELGAQSRRLIAHQRWTLRGGASIGFFTDLAALVGVPITIEEIVPSESGLEECSYELIPPEQRFVWIVHLPATSLIEHECGVAEAGDPLGDFEASLVECVIRDHAPAHTLPIFSYA